MPMIRILGRRWNFASDDLFIICLFDGTWRFGLVLILTIGLMVQLVDTTNQVNNSGQILISTAILMFVQIFTIITLYTISYLATKGSVLKVKRRLPVNSLFTWRLLCVLPIEQVVNVLTIRVLSDHKNNRMVPLLSIVISMSFLSLLVILILAMLAFDSVVWIRRNTRVQWLSWLWHIRIMCAAKCCCLASNIHDKSSLIGAYEAAAESLSRLYGPYDLVPSDVLAGLFLISSRQKAISIEQSHPITSTSWMTISNARHFYSHALAIYSWPIYVYLNDNKAAGLRWIFHEYIENRVNKQFIRYKNLKHTSSNRGESLPKYGGRSFSNLDIKAFRMLLPHDHCDLCYLDFDNHLFRTPFSIVADHEQMAVVVVIRGTMSMRDILTDTCATQHEFTYHNVDGTCHKGILETAKKILSELNEQNLLDTVMSNYTDYQLIICGHSLGAGAAVLLTMMLRDSSRYPNTICYAFSCPKTMTENLAVLCEPFCMAITVGNDIVARLDLSAIEQLKENIMQSLSECDTPKYRIFYNAFSGNLEDQSVERDGNNDEVAIQINMKYQTLLLSDPLPNVNELFVPGCILHLIYSKSSETEQIRGQFRDRHYFKSIRVHPRMVKDHMPAVLLNCLLRCHRIE